MRLHYLGKEKLQWQTRMRDLNIFWFTNQYQLQEQALSSIYTRNKQYLTKNYNQGNKEGNYQQRLQGIIIEKQGF